MVSNKVLLSLSVAILFFPVFSNAGFSIDVNACMDKVSVLDSSEHKRTAQDFTHERKMFSTLSKVESFNQLLQLPRTEDNYDIVIIPSAIMASYGVEETTPLSIATHKFIINNFIKQESKKSTAMRNLIGGKIYGYDGSLIGMVLSIPQSSFMLYSETNHQNVVELSVSHPHKMQKLLDLVISDELERVRKNNNRDVVLGKMKKYTVNTIASTYEKNEVNGDLKYKGKEFIVDGVIKSIDSSFGDQPAVTFLTKNENSIQDPVALFHNAESVIEEIAMLHKGEHLQLKCTGAGELAGSPILSECEFLERYLKNKLLKNQRDEIIAGYSIENIMPSIAAIVSALPDDSGCFVGDVQRCKFDIFNIPSKKMRSASSRNGLTRDLVKNNIRITIDESNKKILMLNKDKKRAQSFIDFNESCFVPFIMNAY